MSKIPGTRMHPAIMSALVVLAALASFNLTSCTPGSELTAAGSDVVLTRYDSSVDFSVINTYAMPDTIFHIVAEDEESPLSRDFDAQIIALFKSNFEAAGYTLVPESSPDAPQVGVVLRATAVEYWQIYSYYPGYPGWGWGCCWYPYYPPYVGGGYAYTTGTLLVDMYDPDTAVEQPDGSYDVTVIWQGTINGILDDTKASKQQRITDSINQLFTQSPYLGSRD